MQVISAPTAMQAWSDSVRAAGRRIGFVPTMGYLHAGHLSLVHEARRRCAAVVASIFVNPLQFGANEDLGRYPRDIDRDTRMLAEAGVGILFLPQVEDIYPEGFQTTVAVANVTRGLCGASRPTHFAGVTTVVAKLFNIVKPHVAVFGRKDFQQLVTIQRMVADLCIDIEIVGAPIVRESDGLAMSSRNAYLSPSERLAGLSLSRALAAAERAYAAGARDAAELLAAARTEIDAQPLVRLDYANVVDPETLLDVQRARGPVLLALAAFVGKTRLIDNRVLSDISPAVVDEVPPVNDSSSEVFR
jgi:pantoate--beta-alanine ligase